MALFGLFGNFTKPGPGVSKDEPPKAAPIRFFEIYFRKFTKLCQVNLIFFIPVAIAVGLMVLIFLSPTHLILTLGSGETARDVDLWNRYVVPLPLILVAPFAAGLTFVTRNFAREEHAFVWSDFWDAVKGNWKYFLLDGVIVYAVYVFLSFAMLYYRNRALTEPLNYVPFWLCVVIAVVFLFAQYYLPIMFVTFDLKFGQAFKNALIFILAGFWRNLLITAVLGILGFIVLIVPLINLVVFIFMLLLLFVVFAFVSYLVNFTVYPVIDRYMIKPYEQQQAVARGEALPEDPEKQFRTAAEKVAEEREASFFTAPEELEAEEEENDEDKYVFINGKLVKKSQLKPAEREQLDK